MPTKKKLTLDSLREIVKSEVKRSIKENVNESLDSDYVTVSDLIERLQQFPQDAIVVKDIQGELRSIEYVDVKFLSGERTIDGQEISGKFVVFQAID